MRRVLLLICLLPMVVLGVGGCGGGDTTGAAESSAGSATGDEGDEAVKGERLDLTIGSSPEGYRLGAAQRTLICARGVIVDGGRCR